MLKTVSEKAAKEPDIQVEGKINWKDLLYSLGALLGLILLSVVLTILSPDFLTLNNLMNIARQSAINSLISVGMLLTILTAGIDLSVGSVLALSTVVMAILIIKLHVSPFIGVLAGLCLGAFLGFMNGILLTKLHLPHPFISTLGTMNIARGLALIVTGATPISGFPFSVQFLGAAFWGPIPVSFILVLIVFIIFHLFLTRTTTGRYIYAVGGNPEAARLSGVPVERILVIVYTLSGFMAAVAGLVLIGRVNAAYPLAGLGYELDAIAAVIIGGASFFGGVGTVWGTLVGALIMAVLRNGLNLLGVSADLQTVAIGAVIIGAVYVDVLRQRAINKGRR
ncbi:monosaccharide ABC transporter membrane protein, CUT2 family [Thermanaeromonas toyohensis ToBE]|uniref:Monosaccharide ABC transporter membrane protein, CUT2 family n=1 Tax=Thermanaeromonas toyohensis ToBE TaxID=698762 RepID=A0A1W1VJ85_9FIRM|nr:ABC transporter permease [Thermanaeromonas toyohensis]SMB93290.1 monosaccharide ABC transporter membrane protein, CUT2 family [Thermanaeromonas toyohensis ToBE]